MTPASFSNAPCAAAVAARVAHVFERHEIRFTIGGEPTFVPTTPVGDEWQHAAIGPTKLAKARAVAARLRETSMPKAVEFFAPGKRYPGEVNPRWAIWLVQERHGGSLLPPLGDQGIVSTPALAMLRRDVVNRLQVEDSWRRFSDGIENTGAPLTANSQSEVWALLLDHADGRWLANGWPDDASLLTNAGGPAGLRLPLDRLSDDVPRRALVLERRGECLSIFLPPLLQDSFCELLTHIAAALRGAGIGMVEWQGVIPADEAGRWTTIGLTADPGVLEINLPACFSWHEYDHWLHAVTSAAATCGLRPWRESEHGFPEDTGGGSHLLWGGPTLSANPFFSRPGWVASILRYWQQHPALSYLFAGKFVGPHSQAPRADESGATHHDLEWAWRCLEALPPGQDHRHAINAAVRFLQTDVAANSHRSEICFDKFWTNDSPAGMAGLIEFRALASWPHAAWSSDVALLWSALAAWLLEHPCRQPVRHFGRTLHDRYFLPTPLWDDLATVLADLHGAGFRLDPQRYRSMWDWRFPTLLEFTDGDAALTIRQASEAWPLIENTVGTSGATSRLVDTSLHRLECVATAPFRERFRIEVFGRPLPLACVPVQCLPPGMSLRSGTCWLAGLRYRRTSLVRSLHPGIPVNMPLVLEIVSTTQRQAFVLSERSPVFEPCERRSSVPRSPCRPLAAGDLTCDLRMND